jgi:hypothetical protein
MEAPRQFYRKELQRRSSPNTFHLTIRIAELKTGLGCGSRVPHPCGGSCEKTSLDEWREQRGTEFVVRRYFR